MEKKKIRNRNPNGPKTYRGAECKKCGNNIRQEHDNRCVTCLRRRQGMYNQKLKEKNFMQTHGCSYAQLERFVV